MENEREKGERKRERLREKVAEKSFCIILSARIQKDGCCFVGRLSISTETF